MLQSLSIGHHGTQQLGHREKFAGDLTRCYKDREEWRLDFPLLEELLDVSFLWVSDRPWAFHRLLG